MKLFSYEWPRTQPRFETEAWGISEMVHCLFAFLVAVAIVAAFEAPDLGFGDMKCTGA